MLIAHLRLGFLLATLVASLHVAAEPRFWTLTRVQFEDGAVATGYFSTMLRQVRTGTGIYG